MFTGIIEEVGIVKSLSIIGTNQLELSVGCQLIQGDLKLGDSVAINGVCLTVTRFSKNQVWFDLSSETLSKTTFSEKHSGNKVNLERALKLGDRLGGHIVQGHVDSCSRVLNIKEMGSFYELDFSLPIDIQKYVIPKGSITINGISLTIALLEKEMFRVAIIPHTFQQTTLSDLKIGDDVHIETDVIAKYIERLLPFQDMNQNRQGNISVDFLKKHGF